MFFFPQILIKQPAKKDDNNTAIYPEHKEYNISQAAIYGRKVTVIINIEGIQIGKRYPEKSGQTGAGQLIAECRFMSGNKTVQNKKVQNKNEKGYCGAQ